MKQRTNTLHLSLINKTPEDPPTILTALSEIETVTRDGGQEVSVFTCDLQLYRLVLDIIWASPKR